MTFTLEELQHIMICMNGGHDVDCLTCRATRVKLESMISEMTPNEPKRGDKFEKPVPAWMKELGVTKMEVVIE
jgi:hypothetical protein